ncbi:MAG: diguanylate cyclase [Solirubrobacterales bacterium]|nr:diguanylate cyclase [Solirubrobacterales bacterium]
MLGAVGPWVAAGLGALIAAAIALALAVLLSQRAVRVSRAVASLRDVSIVEFDAALRLVEVSGARFDELAWTDPRGRRRRLDEVLPAVEAQALAGHCRAALRGESRSIEYRPGADVDVFWVRVVPLLDRDGLPTSGLIVTTDLSDRERGGVPAGEDSIEDAIIGITRSLARTNDPSAVRDSVCEAARLIAGAQMATLLEPSTDGRGLVAKSTIGGDLGGMFIPLNEASTASRSFVSAESDFVVDARIAAPRDRELGRRTRTRSIASHPMVREGRTVGVLAVGWREVVSEISLARVDQIATLAHEAEVAIGRSELLGQLEQLARTDELTGLLNRRAWDEQLAKEVARALRDKQPLCVAMLDLDLFKDYNDRRGHQAGDRLLREASAVWRSALRPYDTLARYGGEEFGAILPSCAIDEGLRLVERLRRSTPEGETVSVGVAEWNRREGPEALVGRADEALYEAKAQGRNRAVADSPGGPRELLS